MSAIPFIDERDNSIRFSAGTQAVLAFISAKGTIANFGNTPLARGRLI
jgi:hypothetical protein